jgi:hypothetical protein
MPKQIGHLTKDCQACATAMTCPHSATLVRPGDRTPGLYFPALRLVAKVGRRGGRCLFRLVYPFCFTSEDLADFELKWRFQEAPVITRPRRYVPESGTDYRKRCCMTTFIPPRADVLGYFQKPFFLLLLRSQCQYGRGGYRFFLGSFTMCSRFSLPSAKTFKMKRFISFPDDFNFDRLHRRRTSSNRAGS